MDVQLGNKRAVITGASKGIGRAIARQLALEGVRCVIGARQEQPLRAAAADLALESGNDVFPVVLDTTQPRSIAEFMDRSADLLGGIDILVNSAARAAGAGDEDFETVTDERILADFEEKTLGYLRCARFAVPHMKVAGWGRVINISGLAARIAGAISAGARNISTVHLTKSMAAQLGRHGITVNAIYPGITVTESLVERMQENAAAVGQPIEAYLAALGKGNSIGRLVTAQEIAYVATFLASPLAAGINGAVVDVSGGALAAVYI